MHGYQLKNEVKINAGSVYDHVIVGKNVLTELEETQAQFRDYLENDQRKLGTRFKGAYFRSFIFNELKSHQKIELFF